MVDEIRELGETLFRKCKQSEITANMFKYTMEQNIGGSYFREIYLMQGCGNKANSKVFQSSLEGKEKSVVMDFGFGPHINDQCPEFPVIEPVTGEKAILNLGKVDETVYLLVFWAKEWKICQDLIQYSQDMLERNLSWEGKAEIIAISLDSHVEASCNYMAEKGWDKVISYWAGPLGYNAEASEIFDLRRIPRTVLVKNGKILWIGDPSSRNLENDISSLIQGKHLELGAEAGDDYIQLTEETYSTLFEQARLKIAEFAETYPQISIPEVRSEFKYILKNNQEQVQGYKFFLFGEFLKKHKGISDKLISDMNSILRKVDCNIKFQKRSECARGSSCCLCGKIFKEQDVQYLCLFCDPKHYHCHKCQVSGREGNGSAKLAHPHSVFVITPDADGLDELKYGPHMMQPDKNLDEDPTGGAHKYITCDNSHSLEGVCSGQVDGIRYMCAHCCDYDLCEKCVERWISLPSEHMINTATGKGHAKSHVFIAIPFLMTKMKLIIKS